MSFSLSCLKEKNICNSQHPCCLHQLLSLFIFLLQLLSVMLSLAWGLCQSHSTGSQTWKTARKRQFLNSQTYFGGVCSTEHVTGCPSPERSPKLLPSRFWSQDKLNSFFSVTSVCEMLGIMIMFLVLYVLHKQIVKDLQGMKVPPYHLGTLPEPPWPSPRSLAEPGRD